MKHIKKWNNITERASSLGKKYKIYLAGPNVFKEDALSDFERLKSVANKYEQIGRAPLDNTVDLKSIGAATKIFHGNVDLMDECDVIIANLEPFRGPNMDDGTAFEIGYGYAKGKIMYGYMERSDMDLKELTKLLYGQDLNFPHVEDFGYSRNLMIVDSIRKSGGDIFKTFEECVIHLVKNY